MDTKACNLTEDEVKVLIMCVAREMDEINIEDALDRMNYLHKRLKAFKDEKPAVVAPPATEAKDGW